MKETWRLIDTGPAGAAYNMALDEAITVTVLNKKTPPTLRFYGWSVPSVSLGCFQRIAEIDLDYCRESSIPVVRRPTGGRAILHGEEVTYSFSSRNSPPYFSDGLLSTYGHIGRAFYDALRSLGLDVKIRKRREKGRTLAGRALCFQSVSYGELSIMNKKVVGSAQKRWKDGFLQQGSIQMVIDPIMMGRVFKGADRESICSSMVGLNSLMPGLSPERLKRAVIESFQDLFGVGLVEMDITKDEKDLAEKFLKEKYQTQEWTFYR
jgi:lipoate-protein ligase A